jgi:nucleoid-associated protein EbfC
MFNKLKQFQDVRSRAKQMQKELDDVQIEGEAGWGKVKVTLNGNQRVVKFDFADEAMGDKTKLEGYAKDAVNNAMEKLQKEMVGKMKDMGGLDLAQDIQGMMGKGQ